MLFGTSLGMKLSTSPNLQGRIPTASFPGFVIKVETKDGNFSHVGRENLV